MIASADGKSLCRAIRTRGQVEPVFVKNTDDLLQVLSGIIQKDDVILTMGAGNVGQIAGKLPEELAAILNP